MNRHFLLAGCVIVSGGILFAQSRDPFAQSTAGSRKPAAAPKPPTPAPAVVQRAPAPKPVAKAAAPRKTSAPSDPATRARPTEVAAGTKAESVLKEIAGHAKMTLEPSTMRRFLATWQPRLAAAEQDLTTFRKRLTEGHEEVEKITVDRTLMALASAEHRKIGPHLTAGAAQTRPGRDWLRQFQIEAAPRVPTDAEQTMRMAESVAFRTTTFSGETKTLMGKAQKSPGNVAGGYLWTDVSPSGGLLVANLRPVPGPLSQAVGERPYAVQNVAALRSSIGARKTALAEQYQAARRDWMQCSSRGDELHRRYSELRVNLPATEE